MSCTYVKTQTADGVEEHSLLERVHPSLQSGGRLFQAGERQAVSDPQIVPEVVLMHTASGSPTARVLPVLGSTARRKAHGMRNELLSGSKQG